MKKWAIFKSIILLLFTSISFGANSFDPTKVEIENAYINQDGKLIIRFDYKSSILDGGKSNSDFFGTNLTFYGNADGFYQLEETGFGGSISDYELSFDDPRVPESQRGRFEAHASEGRYELLCGEEKQTFKQLSGVERQELQAKIRKGEIPLSGLPSDIRRPEYIFKLKGSGEYVYIDTPKYKYSYDFRMFVGTPGNMREVKVTDVQRYRDGGTTYITTQDGSVLFSPSPFAHDKAPSWKDQEIERLDIRKFDLKKLRIFGAPSDGSSLRTPCEKFYPAELSQPTTGNSSDSRRTKGVR